MMNPRPASYLLHVMAPGNHELDDAIFSVELDRPPAAIAVGHFIDTALFYNKPDSRLLRVTKVHHMLLVTAEDKLHQQIFVFTEAAEGAALALN